MDYKVEAQKYKEQFIEDLKELVAIPSLKDMTTAREGAPFGEACRQALDKMMEIGRKAGFNVKDIDGYACVIEYGDAEESVAILGHLDIVPIGEDWVHDPLGCEEVDGFIFGRGVLDDKGPIVAGLTAMRILKENHVKLNKKIQLICGCDEESGSACMKYYVKHEKLPSVSFTPDADFPLIYGEKGICVVSLKGAFDSPILSLHAGERSNVVIGKASACVVDFKEEYHKEFEFYCKAHHLTGNIQVVDEGTLVSIDGAFAHGSMPWLGVNAALHLLNFIGCAYDNANCLALAQMLMDWRGVGCQIDYDGAYMGFLTNNIGIVNIENNQVEVVCDIRYPNDTNADAILKGFNSALLEKQLALTVNIDKNVEPLFLDPNSEFIQTLLSVYREYSNDTFSPAKTIGGGTYAREFENCVAFGPEFPIQRKANFEVGGPHQANEGFHIDDFMTSVAIYAASLAALGE